MKYIAALLLFVVLAQAAKEVLHATGPNVISGSYIVILKEGSGVARRDAHIEKLKAQISATNDASQITFTYNIGTMTGFAAKLSADMLKIELEDPDVDYVEADAIATISAVTQQNATWGISRIANKTVWSASDTRALRYTYRYGGTGAGVTVYIIDTGILPTHVDFGTRASVGFTAFNDDGIDRNGHGTHCSGTIGGTAFGVAKAVKLVGVKVLSDSGSGSWSGVIAGVDFVTAQKTKNASLLAVASMSLGGGVHRALDQAVIQSTKAGVSYSIAAGNSNDNACRYSPANVGGTNSSAITVGATTITDNKASYSNYGPCMDIFAPGSEITSDWSTSNTATNRISGTSMACPHVTGVIALKLAANPAATPAQIKAQILAEATPNVVKHTNTATTKDLLYSTSS